MNARRRIIFSGDTPHANGDEKLISFTDDGGSDSKKVTGEMNLKRFNDKESEAVVSPATLSSENWKMEATRKKLEQRYGEEAEKKGKKKAQLIDFPDGAKRLGGGGSRRRRRGCSKVNSKAVDGSVRERVVASLKRMKDRNEKPKYTVYAKKIVEEV